MDSLNKKAIITGIGGQDGSYLAELLVLKGYDVFGIEHPNANSESGVQLKNLSNVIDKIKIYYVSINDYLEIKKIFESIQPHECYHLAAHSFVGNSIGWDMQDSLTSNITGILSILSAIKDTSSNTKIMFPASSEVFGNSSTTPQNEETMFNPRSIYGVSKVAGVNMIKLFRQKHAIFGSVGYFYNHESPRRGSQFVTKKIVQKAVQLKYGLIDEILVGNINAVRDWGHARDYVRAMWLCLQQNSGDDYIIATGKTHTVKDIIDIASDYLKLDIMGKIRIDKDLFRPQEEYVLCGDISKAEKVLKWAPTISFEDMICEMIKEEILEKKINL